MPERTIESLDPNLAAPDVEQGLRWYDAEALTVEGRGWPVSELPHPYSRLPARAEAEVREPVWQLSRCSAGIAVRFITDATSISARWSLRDAANSMIHMPATGRSGLDLYVRDPRAVTGWRFAGITRAITDGDNEAQLVGELDGVPHECLMYLPLFNGVNQVAVGIPDGAAIAPAPPREHKPIVCYGTSIVHGGCASRPGMAYPAILSRKLGRETLNLGFSGNGQAEPEVAALLAELDPAVYVIDPLPNLQPKQVTERIEPFVQILRAARPKTPIVLVESVTYTDAHVHQPRRERYLGSNAALRAAYQRLFDAGVAGLHYVEGESLLGEDGEATVDGTHPTDLGFARMADVFEPVLRALL